MRRRPGFNSKSGRRNAAQKITIFYNIFGLAFICYLTIAILLFHYKQKDMRSLNWRLYSSMFKWVPATSVARECSANESIFDYIGLQRTKYYALN